MNTLIANDIINMESFELNIEIAERVFRAKVISKENSPSTKLLVGDFGKESYKPMRGSWHNCWWHKSEESAWEDCPNFAGAMGEAWKVVERLHFDGIVFNIRSRIEGEQKYYQVSTYNCDTGKHTEEVIGLPADAICKSALLAILAKEATS